MENTKLIYQWHAKLLLKEASSWSPKNYKELLGKKWIPDVENNIYAV